MSATLVAPIRIPAQQLVDEEYPDSTQDAPVAVFAKKVEESLGYKVPNTVQFKEGKTPRLLAMFQEHDFMLYRPKEVKTYQRQQVERAEKQANKKRIQRQKIARAFLVPGWIISLGVLLATDATGPWGDISDNFGVALGVVVFFSFALLFLAMMISDNKFRLKKAAWTYRHLHRKDGTLTRVIPEYVLKLMMDIRVVIPEVEFEFSELEVDRRRAYDPIVFAFVENEPEFKAPIAIWEEPDFHGQLIDASNDGLLS